MSYALKKYSQFCSNYTAQGRLLYSLGHRPICHLHSRFFLLQNYLIQLFTGATKHLPLVHVDLSFEMFLNNPNFFLYVRLLFEWHNNAPSMIDCEIKHGQS